MRAASNHFIHATITLHRLENNCDCVSLEIQLIYGNIRVVGPHTYSSQLAVLVSGDDFDDVFSPNFSA